jgi:hypothetical protein
MGSESLELGDWDLEPPLAAQFPVVPANSH